MPVPYMQRTRDYYLALGFPAYRWAHFVETPFAPLRISLRQARVGLITTAAPTRPEAGDQGPGAPYNAAAKFYAVYSIPGETEPDLRMPGACGDTAPRVTNSSGVWTSAPFARFPPSPSCTASGRSTPGSTSTITSSCAGTTTPSPTR